MQNAKRMKKRKKRNEFFFNFCNLSKIAMSMRKKFNRYEGLVVMVVVWCDVCVRACVCVRVPFIVLNFVEWVCLI